MNVRPSINHSVMIECNRLPAAQSVMFFDDLLPASPTVQRTAPSTAAEESATASTTTSNDIERKPQ